MFIMEIVLELTCLPMTNPIAFNVGSLDVKARAP